MPDAAWKAFERHVAKLTGGQRRGPDYGGAKGGKTDVVHTVFAIECKLLGRPAWADFLGAIVQAEDAALPHQITVAFIKKKNARLSDTLAVMRADTFLELFDRKTEEADD